MSDSNELQHTKTSVFISYSHVDSDMLQELNVFLVPLVRSERIEVWDDRKIVAGMNWKDEIKNALLRSKLAILLLSADFLASKFIVDDELPPILVNAEQQGTLILPVNVGPYQFLPNSLSRIQAINPPNRSLRKLSKVRRAEIFASLANTIGKIIGFTPEERSPPTDPMNSDSARKAKDMEESVRWLRDAAESGNIGAQAELGAWYALGEMTEKNPTEALKWLTVAADGGSRAAQYNLALIYAQGRGVPKDGETALELLRKAAEQGHADAQYYIGQAYRDGDMGLARDPAEAREWYSKSASQGNVNALNNLAAMCELGLGGPRDDGAALNYFRQAAEKGDADAQHNLGIMYRQGHGTQPDNAEAYRWFLKAAQQGDPKGQSQVGVHLANGWGVDKNEQEAARWFAKAVEKSEPQAEYNLGIMYGKGTGVPEDSARALSLIRHAAEHGHEGAKKLLDSLIK
jgi:TPR repeat protein